MLIFNIHFSFSQVDLRTCNYDCTSNNYTLKDVYLSLSNVNGDPITNTTCTIGEVRQVYIYLNYSSNSNSNIYFARLNSDLTIAGVTTFVNVLLGTIVPGDNKKLLYGPFNWTCGDELSLSNTIIAWKTNSNNDPGANYSCGSYTNSQCDFTNSFVISKPLAVQFTYKACKTGSNTTVKFTSTTNGGIAPYSYAWDFNNDGGTPDSTIANPTYTYTTSNNSAKLTVTDSQNLMNTYILPIIEPAEIMLSETHATIGCSGGTTSLILNVTGGTPGYTYSWNMGATTKDLLNIAPGTYNVTVTDANNCIKTQAFIINQPTTLAATTSQTNVTCFGGSDGTATVVPTGGTATYTYTWSPSGGSNATATGLLAGNYSILVTDTNNCTITKNVTIIDGDSIVPVINPLPAPTTINCPALPVFAEATATDNSGVVSSLTYIESITDNNCIGSYTKTRTWTAKDSCGNTSAPVNQTITVQDITKPTWNPNQNLNVTLECDNIAGLASAQALFPIASDLCDTDVSNIVKVSGQFVANVGCTNAGSYTNTWTVTDDCGNISDLFTQSITIQDSTAPTWTTAAADLNTTLQCSDATGLAAAQNLAPMASDNCGGTVTYTKTSGVFTPASCVNSGTYTNTWVAKDVCNNTSAIFTQVITIEDTTAPTWSTEIASLNMTLQCSDTVGLALAQAMLPTASDLCDADVSNIVKVSGQFMASEGCGNFGTYTNTWTVKDDCGNNSDTFTQVITIEDTTAPIWASEMASLNMTLQCSDTAGLALAQALFPTASDLCDADVSNIVKVSGLFMASEGCSNAGTYTNTWTVKDDCGNTSDTFTQVITIEDTTAPTWASEMGYLNLTLQCSDTAGLALAQAMFPTASDLCDADVSNIVKVSGQFMASERCSNAGTYTNTWTVKDDCGNTSATFTQVITIEDTTAPTWTTATTDLNTKLQCSDTAGLVAAQNLAPMASDNCGGTVTYTKTTGVFTAGACVNSGTYTNTWVAKDVCNNISDTFTQVITIEDTKAPTWATEIASLNMTLQCSDTAGLALAQALFPTASDLCDADVSNIVKVSGQFMASEGCGNFGTYTNTWTVKDDCGNNSDTFTQIITIEDTTSPVWTTEIALNMTLQCSDTAGLALAQAMFPTASDLCDADISNIVKVSGQFMASEGCSNAGTYTNTWTVKDDCGNTSDTFTQIITIEDTTAPVWSSETASLNMTLQCSDTAGLALAQAMFPTASDLCDADVSNIVKVSGQFMASEGCSNAGTYTNTWTVKDDCGNTSDTFTQVITIEDTTIPMFTGNLPTDITVSCDAVPEPAIVEASDNCNSNLPIIFSETKSNIQNECNSNYTLTRTWTTRDCSGNTVSHFQIITVRDTTAPTGTVPANVANLQSIASIPVGSTEDIQDAADNCSKSVNISISDSNNGGSGCEGNAYILTRTYTLTDCAGNKTELIQTFTIENKVFVTAVASNVTCFEGNDGSILVTTGPGTTVTVTNENNEVVGNTGLRAGKYTLAATSPVNTNNQVCSVTTTVIITEPSNVVINLNGEGCSSDSSALNLSNLLPENVSLTGTWTDTNGTNALQGNILNVFGLALGNYAFEYKTNENCPRSFLLNMAINDDCRVLACENVVIHNAFSPNGDGINDLFKIDNIDLTTCYPENSVEIYNRWGILVFETVNYNNTTNYFDGTSRGRTTVKESDGLPTGTYFYIITYKSLDGNNVLKSNKEDGFLYLSK